MRLPRRDFLTLAACAAGFGLRMRSALAEAYPDRPIRLVLPFPPGGVFDIVGRPWADKVKTSLGTVFVDNQPGAGGSLAAQLVAHAVAIMGDKARQAAVMVAVSVAQNEPVEALGLDPEQSEIPHEHLGGVTEIEQVLGRCTGSAGF